MQLDIIYHPVGTTRSGKVIPCALKLSDIKNIKSFYLDKNFSADDLLDAYAVFDFLSVREIRRRTGNIIYEAHWEVMHNIFDPITLSHAKLRANVHSAFDLTAMLHLKP